MEPVWGASPLRLAYQAKWVMLTNVKLKGEVSYIEGVGIQNDMKSLFLNTEALLALGCDPWR